MCLPLWEVVVQTIAKDLKVVGIKLKQLDFLLLRKKSTDTLALSKVMCLVIKDIIL